MAYLLDIWRRERDSNPRYGKNRIPDFESGAFDHSAISPGVEAWILSAPLPHRPQAGPVVQGLAGVAGAAGVTAVGPLGRVAGGVLALRGVMVMTKLEPASTLPSDNSMVALRSGLVNTSRLVFPRLADIKLHPLRWYWSRKKL